MFEIAGALGLVLRTEAASVPDEVLAWAAERDQARAAKLGARRCPARRITAAGYVVEDTPPRQRPSPDRPSRATAAAQRGHSRATAVRPVRASRASQARSARAAMSAGG